MFYQLIKILARAGLLFYYRKRLLAHNSLIYCKGPAIIISNHPNSMMDAILLGAYCRQPLHFIIRSDMFNRPLFRWLLKRMNGIPVFRQSEEKEKMRQNISTIERCREVLGKNGIILIFAEGATELDWKLKPLKSGASRIVWHCLQDEYLKERLLILPVGITYNSFNRFSKTVYIQTADAFRPGLMDHVVAHGAWKKIFNDQLSQTLLTLSPQMHSGEPAKTAIWKVLITNAYQLTQNQAVAGIIRLQLAGGHLQTQAPGLFKPFRKWKYPFLPLCKKYLVWHWLGAVLLLVPAMAGFVLNGPCYFPLRHWCAAKTRNTIFFDSLFFAMLIGIYPIYVLLLASIFHMTGPVHFFYWSLCLPVSGWMAAQWWTKAASLRNYYSLPGDKRVIPGMLLRES